MIKFVLLHSRLRVVRFMRFYTDASDEEQHRIASTASGEILNRPLSEQGMFEVGDMRIVYRRYASLYFLVGIDEWENELQIYTMIQLFVELLDSYFTNVCELDIVYEFYKLHFVLNAMIIDGNIVCMDKKHIMGKLLSQDVLLNEPEYAGSAVPITHMPI